MINSKTKMLFSLPNGGLIHMQTKRFQRKTEDFVCEHCGMEVIGSGYTNHCPHCLWSKHVDVNPGDRLADCQGMMEPTSVSLNHGEHVIHFRCEKCGATKHNKASPTDNMDALIQLSTHQS